MLRLPRSGALTDLSRYPEWNPHIRAGTGQVPAGNRLTLRMHPPRAQLSDRRRSGIVCIADPHPIASAYYHALRT